MAAKLIDYTGKQYGNWTILKEMGKDKVLCHCGCGTEKIVQKGSIVRGGSYSCGCGSEHALKNLTGQVFSNLTALNFKRDHGRTFWKCQCKCGTIRFFRGDALTSGRRKSCGCLRSEQAYLMERGSVGLKCLFGDYKYRAKKRGLQFDLNLSQFKDLTSQNCFYCGIEPYQISASSSQYEHTLYKYNGLDQVAPGTGYSIGSVVPCCGKCNTAKLNLLQEDFKSHIKKIYGFWAFKENLCETTYDFINVDKKQSKTILSAYKNGANFKGLSFNLNIDQFFYLLKQDCFYCGIAPYRKKYSYIYNGIDRIDNKKGYDLGNVCSSCYVCNSAKSTMTQEEFKNHVIDIYEHWASK
jgi:hypothetical protein